MAVYLGSNQVSMVGGQPVIVEGIDTTDATATAADILSGKTAYVNDVKVTGTIASQAAQTITPGTSNKTISAGKYLSGTQTIAGDADLVAANIKSGVNIFNVAGTFTSDATAAAGDIANGKIAYVNGSKVTGTITEFTKNTGSVMSLDEILGKTNPAPQFQAIFSKDTLFRNGSYVDVQVNLDNFGDATAADVLSGKTFTSTAGVKVTGTASAGLAVKSGTTTSTTINTGLSSVSYFMLYRTTVTTTGLVQAVYGNNGTTANTTYCSSYSTWSKVYNFGTSTPTISGGTITWTTTNAAQGGFGSNVTYNWVAFGTA